MAVDEGFDVETDDLETFQKKVQRASDDFRDAGFVSLAALQQFSSAAGLAQAGLPTLTDFWRRHGEGLAEATARLQETALGVAALAQGAQMISTSYQSGDGLGANALNKIDSKVVDLLFAEPKKDETGVAQGGKGANQPLVDDLTRDIEEQLAKGDAANQAGVDRLNSGGYWVDSYTGATVVEVPGRDGGPSQTYVSPHENELGPDLPGIDKYDESTRHDSAREMRLPTVS